MEEIDVVAKKWGHSLGIILPKEIVQSQDINEGTIINIKITSKNKTTVRDLMELSEKLKLPKIKKSTTQIMKEIDKELWAEKW